MNEIDSEYQDVLDQLSVLAPGVGDEPSPAKMALTQVTQRTHAQKRNPIDEFIRSISDTMNKRVLALGATAVLAIALLVGFPSVRAAAGDFLGLFRVEKFAPISVSPPAASHA
ncbi:MAG: hypothetical protein R3C44_16645 [Chloroflexota bacterium]